MNSLSLLFSGRGSNANSIINYILNKKLSFKINKIVCNNINAPGISLLENLNLNVHVLDIKSYDNINKYNNSLIEILNPDNNEILALCGYMNKIPENIIDIYNGNIINIHPSLLPKYKGLNTHEKVITNKDRIHGCSTHYVTKDIDCGPIIAQYSIPVELDDNSSTLASKLLEKEHILFFETLKMIERKEIKLEKNRIYYKENVLKNPIAFN